MKYSLTVFFCFLITISIAQVELIDTLVDLGGYKMHFKILKGEGTPILFEAGAGDDGSIWNKIITQTHEITGATLITYDRSGFGKSELNPRYKKDDQFGIINGIQELELGLKKLGYFDSLILVSHSYGGFYSTLFSSRNPDKVLYNVRVDANLAEQYTDDILFKAEKDNSVQEMKSIHLGNYYLGVNFANTVRLMRGVKYPPSIPAIDIVSPIQRHQTDEEWELLRKAHQEFAKAEPNRLEVIAFGSGHYIHKDNPGLVISAIVKAYVETLKDNSKKVYVLKKALDNSMNLFIESKKSKTE